MGVMTKKEKIFIRMLLGNYIISLSEFRFLYLLLFGWPQKHVCIYSYNTLNELYDIICENGLLYIGKKEYNEQ